MGIVDSCHIAKKPAHPRDIIARVAGSKLFRLFPPRETFSVSSSASDHARSLFYDEGSFYDAQNIKPKNSVKKFQCSKSG
jgi:hypothetical protein